MRLILLQCHGGVGVSITSVFTGVNTEGNTMKKQDIIREYRDGALKSFTKGKAFALQGWIEMYLLWETTGMSQNEFATFCEVNELEVDDERSTAKASSVKQNFSHLDWAVDECGLDCVSQLPSEYKSLGAIRAERYPNKKEAVVKPAKKKQAFDAKAAAKDFTVAQLLAMLAVKGVK